MSLPVPNSYAPFEGVCPSNACERCPVTADIVAGIGGIISNFDLGSPEGQAALDGVFTEKSDILSDSCFTILSRRLGEFKLLTQLGENKIIQLNRNDFDTGLYLIKLETMDRHIVTGKFIVE